jgi:hypothetical protein
VLRADELLGRVEILHVAGDHLNRADAQPHCAGVEEIEIDKLEQRLLERIRVVDADCLGRALRLEHWWRHARLEESRNAADGRQRRARLVEDAARIVVVGKRPGEQAARDALPELAQALDAFLRRIAGDDG